MTSKKCLTGTDRVAEVAKKIKKKFYINVQGDEPLCNPNDIKKIISYAKKYPNNVIIFTKIEDLAFNSPHVPKVIFKSNGDLIYMSRANTIKKKLLIKAWTSLYLFISL